jgi:hypothetical protein
MDDLLTQITGLSDRERKKVLTWMASLPEETVIGIFQDGVKKSFQLKEANPDLPGRVVKYCAIILAARVSGWDTLKGKGYRVAGQEQYDDFSHLRKSRAAELVHRGRTPILRRKILAHWGEIRELKADGMGFRPIADFLARTRKVKTSASYLVRLWKEVECGG